MSERSVVLITGAAQGIGTATAREFAARGFALVLVDCARELLDEVVTDLQLSGVAAIGVVGDLTDLSFAEHAIAQAIEHFGRIDVLVNNAAWRELVSMREISIESWEKTVRVCLTAPAFLARWAARHMERQQRGVIVNVTSIMAQQAAGFAPAYVACKGAMESLTYDLAALYGPHNIRVVAISPGAIDTELSRDSTNQLSANQQSLRTYSEGMSMLGRWGTPQEVARAIAWIAGDDASYLTGTTLVLDGGWMRHHLPSDLTQQIFPERFS
jgi:NAD(P)-dependent dehydrogenase (short-subunit alcohol dehydrogenase family)